MKESEFRKFCEREGIDYNEIMRREEEMRSGVVYVVEYADGIVKIGRTRDIPKRLYQLRKVYRGKETIINKIYVSRCVSNVRKKERDVLNGFTPALAGKTECFKIPFEVAVDKIKQICGEEYEAYANCIEEIIEDNRLSCAVNPLIACSYWFKKSREQFEKYRQNMEQI